MPLEPGTVEHRQIVFGTFVLVSFHMNETSEVVTVYDITWTG
ncbi:hypothetical protein ACFY05_22745 [Microtetraspora fusca]|uniref:Uncharacterized protein n=1 Tax=Microtetraspora fusca TaxID=1997 RepID=A0ABW6V8X5_MICFU